MSPATLCTYVLWLLVCLTDKGVRKLFHLCTALSLWGRTTNHWPNSPAAPQLNMGFKLLCPSFEYLRVPGSQQSLQSNTEKPWSCSRVARSPPRCGCCAACRTARFWQPYTALGKRMLCLQLNELTTEVWIYGTCTLHKHGRDQNAAQNLCLSLPSIMTKEYFLPDLEPSSAQKMSAQVYCLKIKTWPSVLVGVRQNRRNARKLVREQIVKACLILLSVREIVSTS